MSIFESIITRDYQTFRRIIENDNFDVNIYDMNGKTLLFWAFSENSQTNKKMIFNTFRGGSSEPARLKSYLDLPECVKSDLLFF